MTSPSASTSPSVADGTNDEPPGRRQSLARTLGWVIVPLCAVLAVAAATQFLVARTMHHDVRRLFEELREVTTARTLADEVRGVATWVQAAPQSTAAEQPLVFADVRQHLEAARATLSKFSTRDDPSRPSHDAGEHGILARIDLALTAVAGRLGTGSLGALQPSITTAKQDAAALIATIEDEIREIGGDLDQRSGDMPQFLLLLGLATLLTVGGLGVWLLRRVLRPVRALQAAAARLGRGEPDGPVATPVDDEIGELAATFRTMAARLQRNQRELEDRVQERSKEVLRTAKLAQLGTLAAGIAHEINNPLGSIVACADGLLRDLGGRKEAATDDLRDYLQILRKEAMRARDITVRLLRFARHDHGQRVPVGLTAEAHEVGAMFHHQLQDAGVTLRVTSEPDGTPATVLGDASEWRQVLFNLLRNALDASPRGGTIDVELRTVDGQVELVVADSGAGIPAADLDRIFEPFFTTKQPGQGTGLGLAIVHRIVTAHGGNVTAGNGPRGARFTITVPALA
ncbi:MAG: HAMP domain-containing histidine kinase [Planctomycetes bacterium]|nr:HAMP domain-containing histidine kinase [Planctomycetota bacterium]